MRRRRCAQICAYTHTHTRRTAHQHSTRSIQHPASRVVVVHLLIACLHACWLAAAGLLGMTCAIPNIIKTCYASSLPDNTNRSGVHAHARTHTRMRRSLFAMQIYHSLIVREYIVYLYTGAQRFACSCCSRCSARRGALSTHTKRI